MVCNESIIFAVEVRQSGKLRVRGPIERDGRFRQIVRGLNLIALMPLPGLVAGKGETGVYRVEKLIVLSRIGSGTYDCTGSFPLIGAANGPAVVAHLFPEDVSVFPALGVKERKVVDCNFPVVALAAGTQSERVIGGHHRVVVVSDLLKVDILLRGGGQSIQLKVGWVWGQSGSGKLLRLRFDIPVQSEHQLRPQGLRLNRGIIPIFIGDMRRFTDHRVRQRNGKALGRAGLHGSHAAAGLNIADLFDAAASSGVGRGVLLVDVVGILIVPPS